MRTRVSPAQNPAKKYQLPITQLLSRIAVCSRIILLVTTIDRHQQADSFPPETKEMGSHVFNSCRVPGKIYNGRVSYTCKKIRV